MNLFMSSLSACRATFSTQSILTTKKKTKYVEQEKKKKN